MQKQRFDVGILIPLAEEFRYLLELIPPTEHLAHDGTIFYCLDLKPVKAVACLIGQMGPLPAVHVTNRLLNFADVTLLTLLGTGGRLDDDVAVGDVVIATEVNEFQANSRAEATANGYQVQYSGRHWPLDFTLREAITHFEFSNRTEFLNWQSLASKDYACIELAEKERVCQPPPSLHLGAIASGNIVAASTAFKAEIKRINRKFMAIDMEAAGLATAASERIHPIPYLVLRGISDDADEHKTSLQKGSKSAWRRYSVRNAASLLRALLMSPQLLGAANIKSSTAHHSENDFATQLATLLKSEVGGPWAIGVMFGIYSHGPHIVGNHAAPVDLSRLRLLNSNIGVLLDCLEGIKNSLLLNTNLSTAALAIREAVASYRQHLSADHAIALLQNFDAVMLQILCPTHTDENVEALIRQADRLEEDVGPQAAAELLVGAVSDNSRIRQRYVDALANAGMWPELATLISQQNPSSFSRRELEHGIYAYLKLGREEQAKTMIRHHESVYQDNAGTLFRDNMIVRLHTLDK